MAETKGLTATGSKLFVLRLRHEDRDRLDERAHELGISRGELVRNALDSYLATENRAAERGAPDATGLFERLRAELRDAR